MTTLTVTRAKCGCDVVWATTVPKRKAVPLEVEQCSREEQGALWLVDGQWAYSLRELATRVSEREGTSYQQAVAIVHARYSPHLTHFTRCPHADPYRRQT